MSESTPSEGELIAAYARRQNSNTHMRAVVAAAERAINRIKADAWDEGYKAGSDDTSAFAATVDGYVDFDEYEDTPNPYRDTP